MDGDQAWGKRRAGEEWEALDDIVVGESVKAVLLHPPLDPAVRNSISSGTLWQSVVKGRVEDRHHRKGVVHGQKGR